MPDKYRILSIDGGGIRGLIAVCILDIVEQKIRAKTANPLAQLIDYFDLFVGSSTGAIIIAILLCPGSAGRGKYSPQVLRELYMEDSRIIFHESFWESINYARGIINAKYSDKGFCKVLDKYFGDVQLKDLLAPCLITAYDIEARRNFFFRQHRAVTKPVYNFLVKDIVRASSSAPVLFPIAEVRSQINRLYHLIDGGVFAYNPSLCAYAEARRLHPELHAERMQLLSVGTGIGGEPIDYAKAKDWGGMEWMNSLHHIISEGIAESIDFQMKQLFLTCENKEQYLRINCEFDRDQIPKIDDTSQINLKRLLNIAADLDRHYNRQLDRFVDCLVNCGPVTR